WEVSAVVIVGREPTTMSAVADYAAALNADQDAPISRALLADAFHAAIWSERYTGWADVKRAVLLAAVALEIHVKSRLRETVRADVKDLLGELVPEKRQAVLPAIELFSSVAEAATGRSLRKESPDLFERVRKLFEDRNALAHRGEV